MLLGMIDILHDPSVVPRRFVATCLLLRLVAGQGVADPERLGAS